MPGKAKTARKAKPPARRSRGSTDSIDALITASAQALRLPIDPVWHPAVRTNVQLLLTHAALVEEFLLSDDTEPAPVFRA